MLSDQYPQAKSVDPHEVADLSFMKQVESGGSRLVVGCLADLLPHLNASDRSLRESLHQPRKASRAFLSVEGRWFHRKVPLGFFRPSSLLPISNVRGLPKATDLG